MNALFLGSLTNTALAIVGLVVVVLGYVVLIKRYPDRFRPYQTLVAVMIMVGGIILCMMGNGPYAFLSGLAMILLGRTLITVPRRIM